MLDTVCSVGGRTYQPWRGGGGHNTVPRLRAGGRGGAQEYHPAPLVTAQTGHGPHQGNPGVILHLLSQLKLGMDLTKGYLGKVNIPTHVDFVWWLSAQTVRSCAAELKAGWCFWFAGCSTHLHPRTAVPPWNVCRLYGASRRLLKVSHLYSRITALTCFCNQHKPLCWHFLGHSFSKFFPKVCMMRTLTNAYLVMPVWWPRYGTVRR